MINGSSGNPAPAGADVADPVSANDAFDMGMQFEQRDDLPAAEEAYRAADQLGHAAAAVNLGVLLEERDDLDGAEQAFRRADERGDATGAFHLAWMLQEGGDLSGAEQAYRRAEMRGHPAAHSNLRMLLGDDADGAGTNGAGSSAAEAPPAEAPPSAPAATAAPPPVPVPVVPIPLAPAWTEAEPEGEEPPMAAADPEPEPEDPPFVDSAGADLLAVELSQRAAAPRRPPASRAAEHATRASAGRGVDSRRGRAAARKARSEPQEGTKRTGGFMRKALGFGLPVAAFAAAFVAGVAARPHTPAPSHPATTSRQAGESATVAAMTSVPKPSRLVVVKHPPAHKSKPKAAHKTAAATHHAGDPQQVSSPPATSAPPPAPAQATTTTNNGSGGSSVSINGTGTTSGSG
jgi:hypothetical protein